MIQLSDRLQAAADLITAEGTLADIGTDHAYLPIYLVQKGRIQKALALDVKEGPLSRAKEHIEQYGLGAYIETRMSDGAEKIMPGEADIIVLAGMGGGLMQRIIGQSRDVFARAEEIILQPQSEQEQLRRSLVSEGWRILAEDMVKEDGKYYPMMRIFMPAKGRQNGEDPYEDAKDIDFIYGAYLLRDRHPVLRDFLEREEKIYRELLEKLKGLTAAGNSGLDGRIAEVEQKKGQIKEALQKMR